MKRVHVVFHDGGGGHRNAAVALQTIVSEQKRDWQIELIQFQALLSVEDYPEHPE